MARWAKTTLCSPEEVITRWPLADHNDQPHETVIAEVVNQSLKYRASIDFNEAFGNRIRQGL